MKYIRTKDGKITTLKDELVDNADLWVSGGKENILKIADNLDELIDEYLVRYKNDNDEYLIYRVDRIGYGISKKELDKHNFYIMQQGIRYSAVLIGAIFTDKGLIYVAKMNDEGELELL